MKKKSLIATKNLNDEIARIIRFDINKVSKRIEALLCDHIWYKDGLGYSCDKCKYYSGTNSTINTSIEEI